MEYILLLILIIVIVYFWQKNKKKKAEKEESVDPLDNQQMSIENVQAGGLIKLTTVGENMDDYDVTISRRHVYKEGGYEWFELEGDNGSSTVWLSVEKDDELEVNLAVKKSKLRVLGVSIKDLEEMENNNEGEIEYEDEKFYYESSGEADFFKDGNTNNPEAFYYWEFENENGSRFISIEEWEDGDVDVTISLPVKQSQITVFSLK
jgi:preprotein translocase subunit YajC